MATLIKSDFALYTVDNDKYYHHIPTNSIFNVNENIQGKIINSLLNNTPIDGTEYLDESEISKNLLSIASMIEMGQVKGEDLVKIKKIAISPTMKCNLNCTYCYNFQESPVEMLRKLPSITKEALKKIATTVASLPLDNRLNIAFIGGEPLLNTVELELMIKYAIKALRPLNITPSFSVTTNGLLLKKEKVIQLMNRYNISLSVSLDGPKSWNDETRLDFSGKGSYDAIIDSLKIYFSKSLSTHRSVRTTPKLKPGRLVGTYNHLVSLGFNDIAIGSADFENSEFDTIDKNTILSEVDELCSLVERDLVSGSITRFSWYAEVLKSLYFGTAKKVVCGATRTYVAFDTFGRMQACHRYLGNESYELSVEDLITKSPVIQDVYDGSKTKHCSTCLVRSLCGGECYHVIEQFKKSNEQDERQEFMCNFKRKIYSNGIRFYIKMMKTNPDLVKKLAKM